MRPYFLRRLQPSDILNATHVAIIPTNSIGNSSLSPLQTVCLGETADSSADSLIYFCESDGLRYVWDGARQGFECCATMSISGPATSQQLLEVGGMSAEQASARAARTGRNVLFAPDPTFFRTFLRQFGRGSMAHALTSSLIFLYFYCWNIGLMWLFICAFITLTRTCPSDSIAERAQRGAAEMPAPVRHVLRSFVSPSRSAA